MREGYRIRDVSPLSVISRIRQPVLFIHSKEDDYIPPASSELLHRRKRGPKMLYLAESGGHAMSYTKIRRATAKPFKPFRYHDANVKSERTYAGSFAFPS